MANNKTKIDKLHDDFPKLYQTRVNPNWKAIIEAIGGEDEFLAQLAIEVKKQLFISTAERPYLDRLGANVKVSRPQFIGMDDITFRKFVPILSYQPKQVKYILDLLLDIFFFKEATSAYIQSRAVEPFFLDHGYSLEYNVDALYDERIVFKTSDFTDINNATAEEVAAVINRYALHSFAVTFEDNITKQTAIRLFSTTIGSKGSLEITGGTSNVTFQFEGFIDNAGTGLDTEWTVVKVGDKMKYQHTGGDSPGINFLEVGDILVSTVPGPVIPGSNPATLSNLGAFVIEELDITNEAIYFRNLLGAAGIFTESATQQIKFFRPFKSTIYKRDRRAIVWETTPGNITVEMPATPPIIRREFAGAAHLNGNIQNTVSRVAADQLKISDATNWPDQGIFNLVNIGEIRKLIEDPSADYEHIFNFNTRLQGFDTKYTYTSKVGNILTGIIPDLPELSSLNQINILTAERLGDGETVEIITDGDHEFAVGETAIIMSTIGGPTVVPIDGSYQITDIINSTTFRYFHPGDTGTATGGTARVERIATAENGSSAVLHTAILGSVSRMFGPYVWDTNASFVLSAFNASLSSSIEIGATARALEIGTNEIPDEESLMLVDYGTDRQEGPVRILHKPTDNVLFIDPSYVFQYEHGPDFNSSVTLLRNQGPYVLSGSGYEIPPYITDPSAAREILQDLMRQVKSVGIFMEFLIRFPEQLYGVINVYNDPDYSS
jgi:hypothetical protein